MPGLELSESMANAIQLAIGPIFLLVGIGAFLGVMTTRLGRVVDRARALEALLTAEAGDPERQRHVAELAVLDRRMGCGNLAVLCCAISAVLTCLMVATLFVAEVTDLPADWLIAGLFLATLSMLVAGLIFFLREVSHAMTVLRVRAELIQKEMG